MVAPTSEMDVVVFGYRPNKDLDLTLHNKKETRGRYGPRVSTSHLCKTTVCYVAILTNILNSERGRHNNHAQTLDQPPFKFFGSTFLERKVEKYKTQANFSKQLAAELIGGFGREVGWRDIEYRACARRALSVKAYHGSCASDEDR